MMDVPNLDSARRVNMRRLLKFRRREANSGDLQENSAVGSSPPVEPENIATHTTSTPASSLPIQITDSSKIASSSSPITVNVAQLKTEQAVESPSLSAGSSLAPSTSASRDTDIWSCAYKLAENREPELMMDYASHLATLQCNPAIKRDISSSEFVEDILNQLLEVREKKQWQIPLLGNNVIIRRQVEKLTKVLLWSDPVVKLAVSTQPYAALAWSSVSILLPLLTNVATPDEAMLKGFNSISDVQVYWKIFEETYLVSYHRQHYKSLIEPLTKLYSHIIEYQARAICHLSKTQLSRGWQNVAGWNDWAGKAREIEELSKSRSSLISHNNEKEIRERWGRQLREIQESTTILKEIRQVLDASQSQTQRNYEDQAEKDLLQHLASDYEGYKDFNRLRVQGTCEWFFNDDNFCKWRDSPTSGLLWLSAGPGCGKSILSRALIDERRLSLNITTSTVCHFFFGGGHKDRMYGVNALCAILHQLFIRDSSGALIKLALPAHKNYGKALTKNFSELWNILLSCAKSPHAGEIICIFDALDECEKQNRSQLIGKLKEFYCQPQGSSALISKLSFLVTSRPYADIEREFRGFSSAEYLHVDGDNKSLAIRREIDLVIDEHMGQIADNFTPKDQLEISKRLKAMENRTYLWLYVIFQTIKEDPSRHGKRSSIEKLLNNIPLKLSEAYESILRQSECQEETERLLEIITAAARPLTLDEANVALTLALAEEDFTSYATLKDDLWPKNNFKSIVKGLSGLFIGVHDSKLFFIHQTAREFLIGSSGHDRGTWEGRLSLSESSRTISKTCFRFLMLPDFGAPAEGRPSGETIDITQIPTLAQLPPFYCYAADYWLSHFLSQEAMAIDQSLEDARILCNGRQAWVRVAATGWASRRRSLVFREMTDLSLASYLGLKQVVEKILSEEHIDVNIEDKTSGSALSAACFAGQSDVVTLLLNKGANLNSIHRQHGTSLHAALLSGHQSIASILLEKGADVNSKGGDAGTALYIASNLNQPDIVLGLLDRGADINYSHKIHGTALHGACLKGYREIVKILLENGADINSECGDSETSLYVASDLDQLGIAKNLLERGADVNYNKGSDETALIIACKQGHWEVVKLLLENGADFNIKPEYDRSALYMASRDNKPDIVLSLLERGADVNYNDEWNGTALHGVCYAGHTEVVKILLKNGADVNIKGGDLGTALHIASSHHRIDIITILLKSGADINYSYKKHATALHRACRQGHRKVVQVLLENGADINIKGGYFGSALHIASSRNRAGITSDLLKKGADINYNHPKHGTALQIASKQGREKIVAILLANGADSNIRGGDDSSAIQAASLYGHQGVVKLLLESGADVNFLGKGKSTALQMAAREGHPEIVALLLDRPHGDYGNAS
ncbi:uncharacterized protein N7479_000588 [Penicillium vulpinum]|uniref:uncharacterized protein n=1 Tax=Penicillium vulpinum TaxID=29845 RepID=UPI0025477DD7|nr:uncharacterized protein N7479_000588 [Penicillium vulpinum]KAJ5970670.1 hypothetical protein N7479_000588 [Penicillium vulpinum]